MNLDEADRNRAAVAFIVLLAGVGIGIAWINRSGGDPNHLVGGFNATPDAAPDRCWFGVVRGPSETWTQLQLDSVDGGDSIALAKSCFRIVPAECRDIDGGLWAIVDGGVIPCPEGEDAGVCTWEAYGDRCATEVQVLPAGIEWTPADEWYRDYIPGEPIFEVWANGHSEAPWRCACGAPGIKPDAGVCQRYDPVFGKAKNIDHPTAGRIKAAPRIDGGVWSNIPAGEEWIRQSPGEWRGNCVRIPCGAWGEPEVLPAACRVNECAGRVCGKGKAGKTCGLEESRGDAGELTRCVGNKWEQECDPSWECGTGKWEGVCGDCEPGYECKGHKCKKSKDDPDAGPVDAGSKKAKKTKSTKGG